MQTTATVHWNKGSIAKEHNERNPELCCHEEHIDLYNEHGQSFHETIFRQDLTEAYNEVFGEAIEEFNSKQTRKDRMKTVESYMDEIANDNRGKRQTKKVNGKRVIDEQARRGKQTEYEITVKVGNTERERDEYGRTVYDANGHHIRPEELPRELQTDILREYCETFQENNPNFHVTGIELHGDEGFYNARGQWEYDAIHPHITFVPWCDGFKQGLSRQNSMNRALEAMGCGGTDGYDKWAQREQARLESITIEHYKAYCLDHPDFAQEHGELEIYHPVHDKLRQGDMDKEQHAREQELRDKEGDINHYADTIHKAGNKLGKRLDEFAEEKQQVEADKRQNEADKRQNEADKRQNEADRQHNLQLQQQVQRMASEASERLSEADNKEQRLDAQKAEFEAYRASESQKLEQQAKQAQQTIQQAKGVQFNEFCKKWLKQYHPQSFQLCYDGWQALNDTSQPASYSRDYGMSL